MPVLDAASIDYSLLAGAESLRGSGGKEQDVITRKNASTSTSSAASSSSASTPSTSDDEDEAQAKKLAEEELEKTKYAFRTPKKVVSQVG